MSDIGAGLGAATSALGGLGAGQTSSQGSSQMTSDTVEWQKPSTYAPTDAGYAAQIPVFQAAGQQAISAIQQGNNANQAMLQPMIQQSYGAMDNLMDSMGIARPQNGSYQQSLDNAMVANAALTDQQALVSGRQAATTDMQYFTTHPSAVNSPDFMGPGPVAGGTAAATSAAPQTQSGSLNGFIQSLFGGSPSSSAAAAPAANTITPNAIPGQTSTDPNNPLYISPLGDRGRVLSVLDNPNSTAAQYGVEAQHNLDQANIRENYFGGGPDATVANWYTQQSQAATDANAAQVAANKVAGINPRDTLQTNTANASNRVQALLASDPSYQFQMQQGLKAINAQSAASGYNLSPAAAQQLSTYAQGQASSAMSAYRNQLSGIINQGEQAMGMSATSNTTAAQQQAASYTNTGQQIAGATANATSGWQVGPVTQSSTTHQQSSGSNSSGPTGMSQIGGIAGAIGGIAGLL